MAARCQLAYPLLAPDDPHHSRTTNPPFHPLSSFPSLPHSPPPVAGHETSSSALTSTLAFIADHPAILSRLQTEHRRAAVAVATAAAHGRAPAPASALAAMPYALATIRESLRIRPIVSAGVRKTEREVWISSGSEGAAVMPEGCPVVFAFTSMMAREPAWSEDYGEFKPERFLVAQSELAGGPGAGVAAGVGEGGAGGGEVGHGGSGGHEGPVVLAPLPSTFNPFGIGQR